MIMHVYMLSSKDPMKCFTVEVVICTGRNFPKNNTNYQALLANEDTKQKTMTKAAVEYNHDQ